MISPGLLGAPQLLMYPCLPRSRRGRSRAGNLASYHRALGRDPCRPRRTLPLRLAAPLEWLPLSDELDGIEVESHLRLHSPSEERSYADSPDVTAWRRQSRTGQLAVGGTGTDSPPNRTQVSSLSPSPVHLYVGDQCPQPITFDSEGIVFYRVCVGEAEPSSNYAFGHAHRSTPSGESMNRNHQGVR